MKQMMVELTEGDILLARQEQAKGVGHSLSCPIAQALKRLFEVSAVLVDYDTADIYPKEGASLVAITSEPMRRLMRRWDAWGEASPTRFRLRWDER